MFSLIINKIVISFFIFNLQNHVHGEYSGPFEQYSPQTSSLNSNSAGGRKTAIIFVTDGFEEIHLAVTKEILCRAGMYVYVCGLSNLVIDVLGISNIMIIPEYQEKQARTRTPSDILILLGGTCYNVLQKHAKVKQIIEMQYKHRGFIGAIGHAMSVLQKHSISLLSAIARPPDDMIKLLNDSYNIQMNKNVVQDGSLITCSNTGSVMEFAFKIVEILLGNEVLKNVTNDLRAGDPIGYPK